MAFSLDQFYRLNRRALIWIILFGLLWLLRGYFGLVFMTFVLAFIALPLARLLTTRFRLPRRMAITAVFAFILLAVVLFVVFVTPRVIAETNRLIGNLSQTEERLLELKDSLVSKYPSLDPILMGYIASSLEEDQLARIERDLEAAYPLPAPPPLVIQDDDGGTTSVVVGTSLAVPGGLRDLPERGTLSPRDAAQLRQYNLAVAQREEIRGNMLVREFLGSMRDRLRDQLPRLAIQLYRATITLLLALLFSFLITLDIARLGQEIRNLRHSKLHDFYEEAAQPVVRFAFVVGRAIQAQAMIAMANTALTLVGLLLLGIPSLAMLSLIVFVCSFIPVLGVFISTTPIVLVAINAGGLMPALAVIVLIIVIHMIEAYLLNPLIYGQHLKINPVLVLIILFIGHHAFGLWGMLLGVPVASYFIHDVFGVPLWSESRLSSTGRAGPDVKEEELAARHETSPRLKSPPAAEPPGGGGPAGAS